ncbi:unnamed protein product [Camellia sinensis]
MLSTNNGKGLSIWWSKGSASKIYVPNVPKATETEPKASEQLQQKQSQQPTQQQPMQQQQQQQSIQQ